MSVVIASLGVIALIISVAAVAGMLLMRGNSTPATESSDAAMVTVTVGSSASVARTPRSYDGLTTPSDETTSSTTASTPESSSTEPVPAALLAPPLGNNSIESLTGQAMNFCSYGIYAGANATSCAFAESIADSVAAISSGTRQVTSPTTGESYQVTCVDHGDVVHCTGGSGAAVVIVR